MVLVAPALLADVVVEFRVVAFVTFSSSVVEPAVVIGTVVMVAVVLVVVVVLVEVVVDVTCGSEHFSCNLVRGGAVSGQGLGAAPLCALQQ